MWKFHQVNGYIINDLKTSKLKYFPNFIALAAVTYTYTLAYFEPQTKLIRHLPSFDYRIWKLVVHFPELSGGLAFRTLFLGDSIPISK